MARSKSENEKKGITRREFLLGSGVVVAAVALAACSNKIETTTSGTPSSTSSSSSTLPSNTTSSASTPKYGGVMKYISSSGNITGLGWPFEGMGLTAIDALCLETLLFSDNEGNLRPMLAEAYTIADDYKSITFNLRKGVKFHDGSDFNADVVKWNMENYAKMKPELTSVDIIDDYTVRANFTTWKSYLPSLFAGATTPYLFIVSKVAFDKHGIDWMRWNQVGTGPFKFESYTNSVNLKYVKNTDYWGKDAQGNQLPYLNGVEYVFCIDPTTIKLLAQTGEGDLEGPVLPGKQAADFAKIGFIIKTKMNANCVLVGDSAHADSPWANQKVREAVEYAIDREAISKAFGFGYWQAPYQIPPRSTTAYNTDFALSRKFDSERAKQLLTEAGYPNGFKTTIILAPMGADKDVSIVIQDNLAKVGITVDLDYPDGFRWINYLSLGGANGYWHNAALFMPETSLDPTFCMALREGDELWGKNWLRTPEVTQALQAALNAPTMDAQLARAATDLMTKEALVIPIYEAGQAIAYRPYIVPNFKERSFNANASFEDWWFNK